MNKCLITKFMGVINNNNLPSISSLIFSVDYNGDPVSNYYNRIEFSGSLLKTEGNVSIVNSGGTQQSVPITNPNGAYYANGKGKVEIRDIRNITSLKLGGYICIDNFHVSMMSLVSLTNLEYKFVTLDFDFDSLNGEVLSTSVENIGLTVTNTLRGSLENVFKAFPSLRYVTLDNVAFTGSIADFAELSTLRYIVYKEGSYSQQLSSYDIKDLCRAYLNKPTIPSRITLEDTPFTLNGTAISGHSDLTYDNGTFSLNGTPIVL